MKAECQKIQEAIELEDHASSRERIPDVEITEHLRTCPDCAEATRVATRLRQAAKETPPRAGLSSASLLWWRAQIIRDLVADEQRIEDVTRSMRWAQVLGLALLCLLLALGLTWLSVNLFANLGPHADTGDVAWRWLAGLVLAGTVGPLAGFTALWVVWREA